ncbi:hypothetical protein [Halalkalibacter krulwichiae]|uniref:Phenylacetic acid degradation B n=1 Tax=Halalkalibacter krulwichiae TaxID=199441 RepID=A0A1X9M627_9BACI|nr:hypothetical protein [Halalkalibacter krulwichiae]ARK28905.1 Phenylacetic acid degradation B [Halalkalibacter krulwichiae]
MTDQAVEYLLFTRIKRGDDLTHVGSLKAVNDDLAKIYAEHIYDEEDWVEMKVVRKDAIITVRNPEPLFEKEGVK